MFPPFDPDELPNDAEWLDTDLWTAKSPDGRFLLDVGWYPQGDPKGSFHCRVIEWNDWDSPSEQFSTRSTVEAAAWAVFISSDLHSLIES